MKTGTLRCSLFGHKFIGEGKPEKLTSGFIFTPRIRSEYCVRCGIDKEG